MISKGLAKYLAVGVMRAGSLENDVKGALGQVAIHLEGFALGGLALHLVERVAPRSSGRDGSRHLFCANSNSNNLSGCLGMRPMPPDSDRQPPFPSHLHLKPPSPAPRW